MKTRTVKLLRRSEYRARFHRGDYFVIKHLANFIESELMNFVKPGKTVGDLGCGEQPMRNLIEELGGIYTGVDFSQNSQNTVQVLASITEVPLPDNSFDVILCTEVLEHVPDTYRAFQEMARLIKTGGHIIITSPFSYPLHEEPYDFVRLTPYQVQEAAKKSNLEILSLEKSGNEVEVMATVWDNMWSWMRIANRTSHDPMARKALRVFIRLLGNSVGFAGSALLGQLLSKKYYLSLMCVLTKTDSTDSQKLR